MMEEEIGALVATQKELTARIAALEQKPQMWQLLQRTDPAIALSTDLVDLGSSPSIRLRQTSAQSIPDNAATQVTLQAIDWDTMEGADLTNNEIVIRRSGLYLIGGGVRFAIDANGPRYACYSINDGQTHYYQGLVPGSANAPHVSFCDITSVKVGDTVQLEAHQNSTGALNTAPANFIHGTPHIAMLLIADLPEALT